MDNDNQHTAAPAFTRFFLILTEQGNNRLVATTDDAPRMDAAHVGDRVIDRIPLNITLQQYVGLQNQMLTHSIIFDRIQNRIMLNPRISAEAQS